MLQCLNILHSLWTAGKCVVMAALTLGRATGPLYYPTAFTPQHTLVYFVAHWLFQITILHFNIHSILLHISAMQ